MKYNEREMLQELTLKYYTFIESVEQISKANGEEIAG